MVNAVRVDTFQTPLSTGSQAISWVSPNFTPNFLRLFTQGATAIGGSVTRGASLSHGMTDGTRVYSTAVSGEDGAAPTNTSRRFSTTNLLVIVNDAGVIQGICTLTSLDANGFTLNWSQVPGTQTFVHYQALQAKNAEVNSFTVDTAVGLETYPILGSFTPNCLILTGSNQLVADVQDDDLRFFMGYATASTDEIVTYTNSVDGSGSSQNNRGISDTLVMRSLTGNGAIVQSEAQFDSFGLGDFTLNHTVASTSAWIYGYAALEVDECVAGFFDNPNSDGLDETITGLSFTPNLLMTNTVQTSSLTVSDGVMGIGAADGEATPNNAYSGYYEDDGSSPTSFSSMEEDADCMRMLLWTNVDRATGNVTSYPANGVEFDWTQTNGSRRVAYLAILTEVPTGPKPRAYVSGLLGG